MQDDELISLSKQEILAILADAEPVESLLPELAAAARNPSAAFAHPAAQRMLAAAERELPGLKELPQTTYTLYREFRRRGERRGYEAPLFQKRAKMGLAALQVLRGQDEYLDTLQDYIWSICEETTWVMPAHEWVEIDLGAVMAGVSLAEVIVALEAKLEGEVASRARSEIERRLMAPYLEHYGQYGWYRGESNWNGVCNAGMGMIFLLLEGSTDRLARALELVLAGLEVFMAKAFEADGSSTEGAGYWSYGLSNFIPFCEMLRLKTGGEIDILALPRMRAIASYPYRVMLSPGHYANFSDCHAEVTFSPGLITRLAERTGVTELLAVLARPEGAPERPARLDDWRDLLWWNGARPAEVALEDLLAEDVGVARLAATAPDGTAVVLAAKAGHNAENHNQNDIGSLILHAGGETFLCDPGPGLYSRSYFSAQRYENIFANSFGHSVPVVGGQLQAAGAERRGQITAFAAEGPEKRVEMEIAGAYDAPELASLRRSLSLIAAGDEAGTMVLEDSFSFRGAGLAAEEALVTWLEASVAGPTARLMGQKHDLELRIEEPAGAEFALAALTEASEANAKPVPLKRLTVRLPAAAQAKARIRARLVTK